jgi:glycosyltransferase involved in cell wall biosynthesis
MANGILRKYIWGKLESKMLRYVDKIIMPEKNRAKYFINKYKLTKKINIIPNYPLKHNITSKNYIEYKINETKNKIKVLYIGDMHPDRKIIEIVRSFKYIDKRFVLILIGRIKSNFRTEIENIIANNGLEGKIFFLKPVHNKNVIKYVNSADIGILFYSATNLNNYYCASNKLFEFLSCGVPIITNSYPGLIEVVENNGWGVCLNKVDEFSISKAINNFDISKYKINSNYLWENLIDKFLKIYR